VRKLLQFLPLILPTLLYLAYVVMQRRRARVTGADPLPWWDTRTGFWLAVTGVGLFLAVLAGWALTGGAPPGSVYVPTSVVEGESRPGHFVHPDELDGAEGAGAQP
jgi:hypothetical protein